MAYVNLFKSFVQASLLELTHFGVTSIFFCRSHAPNSCCAGDWIEYLSGFKHFLNDSIFVFQAEKRRTRAKQGEQESCKLSTLLLSHCCTRSYDNNMPDNCHVVLHAQCSNSTSCQYEQIKILSHAKQYNTSLFHTLQSSSFE